MKAALSKQFPRALGLFLALMMAFCLAVPALAAYPDRPENQYVLDEAGVLSEETEQEIISQNQTLFQEEGAQIVVAAVDFLDGEDIADYAEALAFTTPERSELFYAVMELPAKYRTVIHLHYYEDYATQEIAEILGIPAATVRTRLRRGRELLKKKLMEAEGYAGQENV